MAVERALSQSEILAILHPFMVNPDNIVSANQHEATITYLVKPSQTATPQKLQQQRRRFAEVSWSIIDNMRKHGIDI